MSDKKTFFASHAKSSAALISLGIHVALIVVALSFVAVTVITKEERKFEPKPVSRPKMPLKKLKVPVTVKKKTLQKPKLRKRIVVQPKLNQNMPDIKMPEISGVKGGIGGTGGDGLGGAAALGFSMPEINIFGVKSKGEKVVLALSAGVTMMHDEMGGITAYTIIKKELIRIVQELPDTALFDVLVFDSGDVAMAFPSLVPANSANAQKVEEWLMPLNAVKKGMSGQDYGKKTLGTGGSLEKDRLFIGPFENVEKVKGIGTPDCRNWFRAAMLAHKLQADTIFVLTDRWDLQRVTISSPKVSGAAWKNTSAGKKWYESYKKGLAMLDEENKRRKAAGKPPKILGRGDWAINREYFPTIQRPPQPAFYNYTPKDFTKAFLLTREKYAPVTVQTKSGLSKKRSRRKIDFSFNVIQFVQQGKGASGESEANFKALTGLCRGDYKTIAGLDAVQSYVTGN